MTTSPSNASPRGLGSFREAARLTWTSWREMLAPRSIPGNLVAGLTICLVALPLNLALALACGLPPSAGLLTGAVAGVVGALFGGSRLQVTGPEVALAPMTLLIVLDAGPAGLVVATFLCGLFQISFGLLGLGELARRVPRPVVGGFMTAIGLLVFDSQLPRLLGLPKEVSSVHEVFGAGLLEQIHLEALAVGALALATVVLAPRFLPRVAAPLLALGAATLLGLAWPSVPTVEPFAGGFPTPSLPDFSALDFSHIVPEALALALLASIDSLLCAASIDARTAGPRTRNDQELIAQGFANMASASVGGMPVAAAVVRSMAAIEAGASTRLAPLSQSVCLGLVLVFVGGAVTYVPLVALAAILLVVGYRLLEIQLIRRLWAHDRWEAVILAGTSAAILATDFVTGVVLGCGLALGRFAWAMARSFAIQRVEGHASTDVVRLEGPLFFGNLTLLDRLPLAADNGRELLVDLSGLTAVDSSGAVALRAALERLASESRPVWVARLPAGAPGLRAELALSRSAHLRFSWDAGVADFSPAARVLPGATVAIAPSGGE